MTVPTTLILSGYKLEFLLSPRYHLISLLSAIPLNCSNFSSFTLPLFHRKSRHGNQKNTKTCPGFSGGHGLSGCLGLLLPRQARDLPSYLL